MLLRHKLSKLLPEIDSLLCSLLAIGFLAEGLLLSFHIEGRPAADVMVHVLLIYTTRACVACLVVELFKPGWLIAPLLRAYSTILHGTWLIHIGCFLYPHPGKYNYYIQPPTSSEPSQELSHDDHMRLLTLVTYFGYHMAVILVFSTLLGLFITLVMRRRNRDVYYKHDVTDKYHKLADDEDTEKLEVTGSLQLLNEPSDDECSPEL